jgi:hypothetical protein
MDLLDRDSIDRLGILRLACERQKKTESDSDENCSPDYRLTHRFTHKFSPRTANLVL